MSRQRKQAYRSRELADLTRQLLYSPPSRRTEVVQNAEQLHDELDTSNNYPIDFVVYRLTRRRVPPKESVMLVGEAIKPDLRLLIDALSRSMEMPCDAADPGKTTAELSESLGVSTKTIARWRNDGLRWRWGVREGKPTVLITQSALDAYQNAHGDRVAKASAFNRLTEDEQSRLIERARRLAQASDAVPQVILRHLAKRTGRSVDALRVLTLRHDTENPDAKIFLDRTGPLSTEQKSEIDQSYRNGATVSALCQRFGKTRSTIYRAINEARAQRIRMMAIEAIHLPIFDREDADEVLMQPVARQPKPRQLASEVIDALPELLKPIYDRPIEPHEVVRSLIVRYNYLKHSASKVQESIQSAAPKAGEMDRFDHLLARIDQVRGDVITAVLPVTLSVVRRQQTDKQRESIASLVRMLHVAHGVLIESIDRYDASVAHSFESVLTNRLLQVLAKPLGTDVEITAADLLNQLEAAGFRSQPC